MEPSPKPTTCQGCPAYSWGIGFIPPSGPLDAEVAFVGQGPGEQEAAFSIPFVEDAPAGWRLTRWIWRAEGQRSKVLLLNVVQCWLPKQHLSATRGKGSREPSWKEMAACWARHVGPFLHGAVLGGTLRHIVPVGAPARRWLTQDPESSEAWVGTRMEVELPPLGVEDT